MNHSMSTFVSNYFADYEIWWDYPNKDRTEKNKTRWFSVQATLEKKGRYPICTNKTRPKPEDEEEKYTSDALGSRPPRCSIVTGPCVLSGCSSWTQPTELAGTGSSRDQAALQLVESLWWLWSWWVHGPGGGEGGATCTCCLGYRRCTYSLVPLKLSRP